jgi:hypothetical protein
LGDLFTNSSGHSGQVLHTYVSGIKRGSLRIVLFTLGNAPAGNHQLAAEDLVDDGTGSSISMYVVPTH